MITSDSCRSVRVSARRKRNSQPPLPTSSEEVMAVLNLALRLGHADASIVAHLTEMGMRHPKELVSAFRAYRARQVDGN